MWRRRKKLVPPPELVLAIGGGDFEQVGEAWKRYLIEDAGLRPDEKILDVGCGVGRIAVPLTGYLAPPGAYEGFDIVEEEINWCRAKVTPHFPLFTFRFVDVYNKHYNPGGAVRAADFVFPYADALFDVVVLTSVFTHMLRPDLTHYLAEIARVLKPAGRCVITYFLLNEEARALHEAGRSKLAFVFDQDGCFSTHESDPEAAVAYDERSIRELYPANGLEIVEPMHYGSWCGRERFVRYQDIVRAVKR